MPDPEKTALDWARKRGCRELKVETQNNNSAAVRFYLKQGCELRQAIADAYQEFPGEQKLLFYRPLA
ncbi:MAG: GNAT family N-acetyltransferase [Candidatus Syntrophosphaera sp.]|nr:GNAT family N-acetyltransferase [Candidatus Syntrophosphaera sp.]